MAKRREKGRCRNDEWNKDIAPSPELRVWFGHKPENFQRFAQLYTAELENKPEELKRLQSISEGRNLTLLYAAKDPQINHAIILLEVLRNMND